MAVAPPTSVLDTVRQLGNSLSRLSELPKPSFWVDFDAEADVLYVTFKKPQQATDSLMMDDEGVLLSYRGEDLVGITLLDATKRAAEQSG